MHPVVLFPSLVLLLSLVDLAGWALHLEILTSGMPHFSTMKPNTALALGLLAVCCRARAWKGEDHRGRLGTIPRIALAIAMLLSVGTLVEYASGKNLGLDSVIMGLPFDRFGDPPGRMALGTAICLTFTGLALAILDKALNLSVWLVLMANIITTATLVGYVLNRGPLMDVAWLRSMSIPTALCVVCLGLATLTSRRNQGPIPFLVNGLTIRGDGWLRPLNGLALALMGAIPCIVAMRIGIPEALMTLLCLCVAYYSAHTWSDNARPLPEPTRHDH